MTIPASAIVSVNPGVVSSGGHPLTLNGLILTRSNDMPASAVLPFPSADAVAAYFGPLSEEARLARNYFLGFDNSTIKPSTLFFALYLPFGESRPAWLRGRSLVSMTLEQLRAVSGYLSVTVTRKNVGMRTYSAYNLDLSAAYSFSDAADLIGTALKLPAEMSVSFDSFFQAFVINSGYWSNGDTISVDGGGAAAALGLADCTISPGVESMTPEETMNAVKAKTQNWGVFMTASWQFMFERFAFATWTNGQNNRYAYVDWDPNPGATEAGNTDCFGAQIKASGYSGTVPIYMSAEHAAAFMGMVASIDFTRRNGRITFAFKSQSGLTPSVTDQTMGDNLVNNGYNFYGSWATANDQFNFFYNGQISGPFAWADARDAGRAKLPHQRVSKGRGRVSRPVRGQHPHRAWARVPRPRDAHARAVLRIFRRPVLQGHLWMPLPGPQAQAYGSLADVTGYGGAAGGGKTDLIAGLALTRHSRVLILRREKAQTEGIEDDPWQVIPTAWVEAAQARWRRPDRLAPMDSLGVDVARGGKDQTIIARRHGAWYDQPLVYPGSVTPDGSKVAGLAIAAMRDRAVIHIDVIGVGSSP